MDKSVTVQRKKRSFRLAYDECSERKAEEVCVCVKKVGGRARMVVGYGRVGYSIDRRVL